MDHLRHVPEYNKQVLYQMTVNYWTHAANDSKMRAILKPSRTKIKNVKATRGCRFWHMYFYSFCLANIPWKKGARACELMRMPVHSKTERKAHDVVVMMSFFFIFRDLFFSSFFAILFL